MAQHSEEDAILLALQLAAGSVLPMVLKSALELELFDLIRKADQPNISASELAALLPTSNPGAPKLLDRILRLLSTHSLLACSRGEGGGELRYSLGPLGKFFTKNEDGVSLGAAALLVQDKVVVESWYHLNDAILEGGAPFKRAYGKNLFEYAAVDQRFNKVFNNTMAHSTVILKNLIQMYDGFEGVKTLVDIGGGTGATLNMIISKYPSMKGINFDLPHVIKDAPPYPGVEHVAGDMFVSMPKGDAILMKWITHSWSDEDCLRILRSCKEALPENGKVIIADYMLPDIPTSGPTAHAFQIDVMMLAYDAQERTEAEFRALAKQAGFKEFRKVRSAFTLCIMEFYK